ncbi:MAG: hypothetical protein R2712_10215 [Vicinamibacterales bacterium]
MALAQSVFTHLRNSILRCLGDAGGARRGRPLLRHLVRGRGRSHKTTSITHDPGGVTTFPDRDPYHYEFSVFEDLARRAGLIVADLGAWNHPRAQRLMVFRRPELPLMHGPSAPALSVVVVVFDMAREAPRTLFTLSPAYQGLPADTYEVIVVDNGSSPPLGRETAEAVAATCGARVRGRRGTVACSRAEPGSVLNARRD